MLKILAIPSLAVLLSAAALVPSASAQQLQCYDQSVETQTYGGPVGTDGDVLTWTSMSLATFCDQLGMCYSTSTMGRVEDSQGWPWLVVVHDSMTCDSGLSYSYYSPSEDWFRILYWGWWEEFLVLWGGVS